MKAKENVEPLDRLNITHSHYLANYDKIKFLSFIFF